MRIVGFKGFLALILAVAVVTLSAESKAFADDEDIIGGYNLTNYEGYSVESSMAAVIFDSFDDYAEYAPKAERASTYLKGYDYICVPTSLVDYTDCITQIYITPNWIKVTYVIDGEEYKIYHQFRLDETKELEEKVEHGKYTVVNDITVYSYSNGFETDSESLGERLNYFSYKNQRFALSENISLSASPITRLYRDGRLVEDDGELYCINSDGNKLKGWVTVDDHTYYFMAESGAAARSGVGIIDNSAYLFNFNGVCTGKYSGTAVFPDGSKVHYTDGNADTN